jgi:hypothetical protein
VAWTWRYEDDKGEPTDGPHEAFASQSDAESWLGQTWRELLTSGVVTVALMEDERTEYRMSLLTPGE